MVLKIQQNSLFQVGLVCLMWLICEQVANVVRLPISGGILGLGVVFILLITKRLKLDSIKQGTELLLKDMLLFFIPSVLGILKHQEFLSLLGLKILFVILLSTVSVMLVTAVVVDYCYHWRMGDAQ
ncbi:MULTISPECIES: CidA/LrgA family protein [Legionella]|uniref:Holin-like protein n=1 Tax=Legionella maceachernii TaxID=466 RepID=A0A0W0W3K7_9GAMM|nr:CidA/LrgA family protein [Legionella maceachernii]KTD27040.1 holin-like protein [Legionella maceachernii]SKA03786.1 holin-like protein [Legionella maceachernii]SUP00210.1 Holin-like protein CidA [Legionella maceachernii]